MSIIGSAFALTIYFTIYGIVHSWLASASVKGWARRMPGLNADRWYRLAYNAFAVVTLLPMLTMMGVLPSQTLYVVSSPGRWVMMAGQFVAVVLAAVSLLQTDAFHFLGLSQVVAKDPTESASLNLGGFYVWVRHPLYTFSLIFIWLTPVMTTNTLTAFILFTLYFYVGSIYEERRMVTEFGQVYEAYRQQIPGMV